MDEMQNAIDIATLKADFANLSVRVTEVRDEMRSSMAGVNTKLDTVLRQIIEQKATSSMRSKLMAAVSHFSAGALPLVLCKLLHIPLSLG